MGPVSLLLIQGMSMRDACVKVQIYCTALFATKYVKHNQEQHKL